MLTIKAPMRLQSISPIRIGLDLLGEKIAANYQLIGTEITSADLLHMATREPELFLNMECHSFLTVENRVHTENRMKLDLLNQLVNRLLLCFTPQFTYQDEVFVVSVLQKIGISDVREFMRQMHRHMERNTLLNRLLHQYIEHGMKIAGAVDWFQQHLHESSETALQNTWDKECRFSLYLHDKIFERLMTAECDRIMYAYNCQADRGRSAVRGIREAAWMEQADAIWLSRFRKLVLDQTNPAVWQEHMYYEIRPFGQGELSGEKAVQHVAAAILENMIQKIHCGWQQCREGSASAEIWWRDYTRIFCQSASDVLERLWHEPYQENVERIKYQAYMQGMYELVQDELKLTQLLVQLPYSKEDSEGEAAGGSMVLSLWENQNIQRQLSGKIQLERRLAGQAFLTDAVVEEEREYRETLRAFRDAYQSSREMVKGHWSLIRQGDQKGAKQRYELEELSGQDVSRMHVTDGVSDGTGEREQREIRQMYPIDHDWNDADGQIQEDGSHRLSADKGQHGVNAANMTESEHRQHIRQIQETVNVLQGIIDIQSGQEHERTALKWNPASDHQVLYGQSSKSEEGMPLARRNPASEHQISDGQERKHEDPTPLIWQTGAEEPALYEQKSEAEERMSLKWNPVSDQQILYGQGSKSEESIPPAKNPASDQQDSDGQGNKLEYRQILQMLEAGYSQNGINVQTGQGQDPGHDYISVFLDRYSEWMSESDPPLAENKALLDQVNLHNLHMKRLLEQENLKNVQETLPKQIVVDQTRARQSALRALEDPQAVLREIYDNAHAVEEKTSDETERILRITGENTQRFYKGLLGYSESPQDPDGMETGTEADIHVKAGTAAVGVEWPGISSRGTDYRTDDAKQGQFQYYIDPDHIDPDHVDPDHIDLAVRRVGENESAGFEAIDFVHKPEQQMPSEFIEVLEGKAVNMEQSSNSKELQMELQAQIRQEQAEQKKILQRQLQEIERKLYSESEEQLTRMMDRSLKSQVHAISDIVYRELERRLKNEQRRRGY